MEEDHYYPFGLTLNTVNNNAGVNKTQPYLLTSKELESNFGINSYDFGARQFDMTIGRWTSVDPLAEKMRRHSPYNYAFNNPVRFIDPDGMSPDDYYDYGGHYLGSDGEGTNIRLIHKEDYNKATANGTKVNQIETRKDSRVVTVEGNQTNTIDNLYSVGEANHKESATYIVLNNEDATLGFETSDGAGTENTAQVASVKFDGGEPSLDLTENDATVPHSGGTKVIVGVIHPHPTPTDGSTLVAGVSETDNPRGGNDMTTAMSINAPVYAVDKNYIHKVDQKGNVFNKNPRTMEVLRNSLETKGGKLP